MLRRMKLSDARLAALFLVSVCVLAFEIEVMRVFSVGSWSNFGSMVISIALLGFGLAGTLLTLMGERVRTNPETWMASSAFALGPSMAIAHTVAQHIPFNPVLIANDPAQLWWIALYYLVYGIPFFAGGIFIGTVFTTLASRMHLLYFWNMLGSGDRWSPHPGIHVSLSPGFPHLSPGRDRGASCPPLLHPLERPGGQVQDKVSRGMLCHPHDSGRVPAALAIRPFERLRFQAGKLCAQISGFSARVRLLQPPGRDARLLELLFPFRAGAQRQCRRHAQQHAAECLPGPVCQTAMVPSASCAS